ncbi:MAG: hypothetical protein JWN40_2970 [Phycisphaerales bacterium]|nr:hypothetical protein [Phycisphaerales bacterium]
MAAHQDYRERERLNLEALRTIEKMFAGVEFSPEEQRVVEDAGRKLVEYSYTLMCEHGQNPEVRPMVVMYAMAGILGGHWVFEGGIPQLRAELNDPPRVDESAPSAKGIAEEQRRKDTENG